MKTNTKIALVTGAVFFVISFIVSVSILFILENVPGVAYGFTAGEIIEITAANSLGCSVTLTVLLSYGMKRNKRFLGFCPAHRVRINPCSQILSSPNCVKKPAEFLSNAGF